MAEDDDKHSKTEQPTGRRLEKAREKGAPPSSQMLSQSFTLLAGIVVLYLLGSYLMNGLKSTTVQVYSQIGTFELTEQNVYTMMLRIFGVLFMLLAPVILAVMSTGILAHIVQDNGRLDFQWGRITFDISKLNFISGFGKLFNKEALVEILKSLIKIFVIGWIAYQVLRDELQNITVLAESDVNGILSYTGHVAFKIVTHTCGIMIVISILDMAYVKWRYIENLKMTKQEVKDETKDMEGNPEIKGKIKRLQFQAARRRLTKIIPTADVVITNPTHFAVALKYDRSRMVAPMVIAKGADEMALAIKEMAREHKVTLVENRFLARELYDQVAENQEIPESLYAAVAEVLAYVYRLKGAM
ncbi:flagellar biosynthesis protein FlhB [Trichlorobacter lovleyi]|uniref:Flagellar biosynthetic protein FlhB n=1 Tax=Trichlorobacter lovleyi (strain ATCC BAA-1151 / DSM 17278 / SZ) TaxID=398767 RepID=B3EAW0_TRIL1|nr:flagellar biosynthesis protein FlhB [Trichlorobacter lovleyi]ACD96993.1 flagellar biosynthetic protein FlhB [Trichlorobacter lovleyi SZ]